MLKEIAGRLAWLVTMVMLVSGAGVCAHEEPFAGGFAADVSDSLFPYLAVGEASLLFDGTQGESAALQGLKALVATDLATTVLKYSIKEKRPHGQTYTSFPSRHASAAFCMATVLSEYENSWGGPAYGAAALIGWSRVETKSHYWWDVVAGAALGHFIAKAYTKNHSSFSGQTVGCKITW